MTAEDDDVKWTGAALESLAASRTEPSEKEKEQSRAYKEIVCSVVLKDEDHVQEELPEAVRKHDGRRFYTVTTIASSARYGGTRTVVVCSTFERAKEIVESNEGDIFEMSYYLVVIEAVVADWLYVAIDEQYWYVWEPGENGKDGRYLPIERPAAYVGTCGFGIG